MANTRTSLLKTNARSSILNDVAPAQNQDIPQRPIQNKDANKPVTAEQLQQAGAVNSNQGIDRNNPTAVQSAREPLSMPQGNDQQQAPASPEQDRIMNMTRQQLDSFRRGPGLTNEQKQLADEAAFRYMEGSHPLSQDAAMFSSAVDPNTPQYAAQQRQTFQEGMTRAAQNRLTPQEISARGGFDQVVVPLAMPQRPSASPLQQSPATRPTLSFEAWAKQKGYDISGLKPEELNPLRSGYNVAVLQSNNARALQNTLSGNQATAPAGTQQRTFPASPSAIPVRSSAPAQQPAQRLSFDEQMLQTARDRNASPESRAQATAWIQVQRLQNNPRFANLNRLFQQEYRNRIRQESTRLAGVRKASNWNRRLMNYNGDRSRLRALQQGDPYSKIAIYQEILKDPRFARLNFE